MVTIVGPGGIGKTTVALAVAQALIADYRHGVWLVDLAPLHDAKFVATALATVLGLAIHAENVGDGLMIHLRDKQMLIVIDSCEHFTEAGAALAEQILASCPGAHILVTSREPLRARASVCIACHRLRARRQAPPV
jgi:predicted ATPase